MKLFSVSFLIFMSILAFGCAQSGSRMNDIDQSVAMMNLQIDALNAQTESEIQHRQDILRLIQDDLRPRTEAPYSSPTPTHLPTASPTPVMNPNDIQSVSLEDMLSTSSEIQDQPVSKMETATQLINQREYSRAAYIFYEVYLDEQESESIREQGLFNAGEAFYLNQDWNQTVDTYLRLFNEYPNSNHIPKGLLYTGKSYEELGQEDKAQSVYQYLLKTFPRSDEAKNL